MTTPTTYVDLTRFGSGGAGTTFVTFYYDIPVIGMAQVGVAFNADQLAFFGSGAANVVIPALVHDYQEGRLTLGTAALTALELYESFRSYELAQNRGWSVLGTLSAGRINGYVEDLQGTIYTVGVQAGPVGLNVFIPDEFEGSIFDWYNSTPGAGWELSAGAGFRLNAFLETAQVWRLAGPSREELEQRALNDLSYRPPTGPNIDLGNPFDTGVIVAPCFSANTVVLLMDGSERPIGEIETGDSVAAFDERDASGTGPLRAGVVTRLIPGITTEWIVLDDASSACLRQDTRVTPGHRYLRPDGGFMAIGEIIAGDGLVVDADGNVTRVTGTLPRATDAGSDATLIEPEPVALGGLLVRQAPVINDGRSRRDRRLGRGSIQEARAASRWRRATMCLAPRVPPISARSSNQALAAAAGRTCSAHGFRRRRSASASPRWRPPQPPTSSPCAPANRSRCNRRRFAMRPAPSLRPSRTCIRDDAGETLSR